MAHGTCEACRFYKTETEHAGVCRLKPPILNGSTFQFPVTAPDQWCGEFQRDNSTDLQRTRSY